MPLFTPDGDQRGVLIKIDDLDGAVDEHKLSVLFNVGNASNEDEVSTITNHLVIDGHNVDIPIPFDDYATNVKTECEYEYEQLGDEQPQNIIYQVSASDIVQAAARLETTIRESNQQRAHVTFTVGIIVAASVLLGCSMIFMGGVLSSVIKRW